MNPSRLIAAAIALCLSVGSVANAQGWQRGDGGARAEQYERRDGRDGRRSERFERREDRRVDQRRAERQRDYRQRQRIDARRSEQHQRRGIARHDERWDRRDPRWNQRWQRGAGPRHDLRRGGRLPPQYRRYNYVVDNWRGHNLRQPPAGYHWVQTGSDYVLAAIASGVILSIVLGI